MSNLDILILAITQGLTEFLPVSSSGHLIIARLLFGISDVDGTALDSFLHIGTLVALLTYYGMYWWKMAKSVLLWKNPEYASWRRLLGILIIASIPAVVVGLWWPDWLDSMLRAPRSLVWQILVTAAALLIGEWLPHRDRSYTTLTWKESAMLGISQAIAIVPAISRSGMTIAMSRSQGLTAQDAVTFSFLMAVPVLAGAGLLSLPKLFHDAWPVHQLLLGFVFSWLSGLAGISLLTRLVRRVPLTIFAAYLVLIAIIIFFYGS